MEVPEVAQAVAVVGGLVLPLLVSFACVGEHNHRASTGSAVPVGGRGVTVLTCSFSVLRVFRR